MNQEVTQEVIAEVPAPEQVATAAPESVEVSAPEQSEAEQKAEAEKVKTFTQEELDAAIGKRLAREQRKWEREQAQRHAEMQVTTPDVNISVDQFETPEDYAEALAERKAIELIAKREAAKYVSEVDSRYFEKVEDAKDKYDDYEQVAHGTHWHPTEAMVEAIKASEIAPDLAYHLGSNPKEAERISRLSPILQAKEIGRIEAKLAAEPPKPTKTSSAPAPIAPVTARGVSAPSYDTTDARATKSLSTSEWIAAENKREREKMAARYNR